MTLTTRDVYFSRTDGKPLKFYIRTLDGYKLAAAPETDPIFGILYQPVTAEVAKNYLLWKRRGRRMQDPFVPKSQYFNPSTGEPVRWYARLPNGKLEFFIFTLPGFHLSTGCGSTWRPWRPSKNTRSNESRKIRQRQAQTKPQRQVAHFRRRRSSRHRARRQAHFRARLTPCVR